MGIQEIPQVSHPIKDLMNTNSPPRIDPLVNEYSTDIYNNLMLVDPIIIHRKYFAIIRIIKFKFMNSFK